MALRLRPRTAEPPNLTSRSIVSVRAFAAGVLILLVAVASRGGAPKFKVPPTASIQSSPAVSPSPIGAAIPAHPDFRYLAAGPSTGWVLEFSTGIFRSQADGPWVGIPLPNGSIPAGLFALDDDRAWAVTAAGDNLAVFRTANGGSSWQSASVGPGAEYPIDLRIGDGQHGVLAAGDPATLYSTADGGATWSSLARPPPPAGGNCSGGSAAWLHDRTFIGAPGLCVGTAIQLSITHDGGNSWQKLSIPQPAWSILDPQQDFHTGANAVFLKPTYGYAIGAAATCCGGGPAPFWALLASHEGGAVWTSRTLPQPVLAADFSQAPLLRFVVYQIGKSGERWSVYQTSDDAATLTQLGPLPADTRLIAFRDQLHGFAAGLGLVSTADGGRTWTPLG